MLSALLLSIVALAVPATPPANIGPITLEDLVRESDLVVVGKVTRIVQVRGSAPAAESVWTMGDSESTFAHIEALPVAEIEVERVLEGPPELRKAYFLAMGTWTCDITGAEVGERGLYFLGEDAMRGNIARFAAPMAEVSAGASLHRVLHAGRGRMKFVGAESPPRVECWEDVILPNELLVGSGCDSEYAFIRHVLLASMQPAVCRFVTAQLPSFRIHGPARAVAPSSSGPAQDAPAWELSSWGDGVIQCSIRRDEDAWPEVPKSVEVTARIAKAFEAERFLELPARCGEASTTNAVIVIEQVTARGRHRVQIGDAVLSSSVAPSPECARALRLYVALREHLPDERASDDRPRIRELLERR